MKLIETFRNSDAVEYDAIINDCKVGYIVQHIAENIFESYYDYDEDCEQFVNSSVTESLDDAVNAIYDLSQDLDL